MNAHTKFDNAGNADIILTPTPPTLEITPRDRRFGREAGHVQTRWWLNNDPIATAFYNALSVTFPKGEAFFIESVKAHRDGTPPKLAEEIRSFTMQEVMHSREHLAFNRRVVDSGYDVTLLEKRVDDILELVKKRRPIINLAATMALEHFTAILARELLENPKHLKGAEQEAGDLWRWHALEEIEHKAVAYDTWLYATRDWTRFKRWWVKSLMMLLVTQNFIPQRLAGMLELLRQDGITGYRAKAKLLWYAFGNPGMFRKIAVAWGAYFLPGFHPWNADETHLLEGFERGTH
jgi:uncharacterized protein